MDRERLRLAMAAERMGSWEWNPTDDSLVWDGFPVSVAQQRNWRGSRAAFLQLLSDDDRASLVAALDRCAEQRTDLEVELRVTGTDGTTHWLRVLGRAIVNTDRITRLIVGLVIDVTARRLGEERAVKAEKLRALGQLAAGVAHDLNQSFALVSGYGELALHALAQPQPDLNALAEYLGIIRHATIGASETVRQILTYARNQAASPARPVDVMALLREVARFTAPKWRDVPEAEGRPIGLVIEPVESPGSLTIVGWHASLHDALTNLVFNAVDALPSGGNIRLAARRTDTSIEIDVADDGVGMTEDVRSRIFEPFFTTRGERGTGLGLARVQEIVHRHGGEIAIDSAPGQGTLCRIQFPVAPAPTTTTTAGALRARRPARHLRVLIVEDLPMVAAMLSEMVQQRGHVVVKARSAEEALLRLERSSFDLVVSDLGLGAGMNGWQLAEQVRSRWPGLRFGLATGWEAAIDPDEARQRGVSDLLAKPFTIGDVLRFLQPAEYPSEPTSSSAGSS